MLTSFIQDGTFVHREVQAASSSFVASWCPASWRLYERWTEWPLFSKGLWLDWGDKTQLRQRITHSVHLWVVWGRLLSTTGCWVQAASLGSDFMKRNPAEPLGDWNWWNGGQSPLLTEELSGQSRKGWNGQVCGKLTLPILRDQLRLRTQSPSGGSPLWPFNLSWALLVYSQAIMVLFFRERITVCNDKCSINTYWVTAWINEWVNKWMGTLKKKVHEDRTVRLN